jgi:hypothetical protein
MAAKASDLGEQLIAYFKKKPKELKIVQQNGAWFLTTVKDTGRDIAKANKTMVMLGFGSIPVQGKTPETKVFLKVLQQINGYFLSPSKSNTLHQQAKAWKVAVVRERRLQKRTLMRKRKSKDDENDLPSSASEPDEPPPPKKRKAKAAKAKAKAKAAKAKAAAAASSEDESGEEEDKAEESKKGESLESMLTETLDSNAAAASKASEAAEQREDEAERAWAAMWEDENLAKAEDAVKAEDDGPGGCSAEDVAKAAMHGLGMDWNGLECFDVRE